MREPRHKLNSQYIAHCVDGDGGRYWNEHPIVMQAKSFDTTGALPFTMVSMKPRLFVLLLCVSLLAAVQAKAKTTLPDACGDPNIKFEVSTLKDQPAPAPPEPGKAQIIFVENFEKPGFVGAPSTTRVGVDGAWVGANQGNSYFVLTVDPGVHHVCVVWRGNRSDVEVKSLTAEPGKIYYFEAKIVITHTGQAINSTFELLPLDNDTGTYRVKAWKLATWKTNK